MRLRPVLIWRLRRHLTERAARSSMTRWSIHNWRKFSFNCNRNPLLFGAHSPSTGITLTANAFQRIMAMANGLRSKCESEAWRIRQIICLRIRHFVAVDRFSGPSLCWRKILLNSNILRWAHHRPVDAIAFHCWPSISQALHHQHDEVHLCSVPMGVCVCVIATWACWGKQTLIGKTIARAQWKTVSWKSSFLSKFFFCHRAQCHIEHTRVAV